MFRLRTALLLAMGLGLGWALGCSSPSSPGAASAGTGTMSVHLVDGPIGGFQEINLDIQSVEISGSGGWITLGTPNRVVNLLDLTGGVSDALVPGATLPAGHYGQMRLILGARNTLKLVDGTVEALKVPSGMQSGVKLLVSFDVVAGTTKDVWIDFDASHSIQVVQAGNSGQYLLRPTIRAYDKLVTGSIHGVLTDAANGSPLAGVVVLAQSLDKSGAPVLQRSTVTDAAGAYILDLLPMGGTYFVVSQPVVGTRAYDAKASQPFAVDPATPVLTWSAAFAASTASGGVGGTVTPVASTSDTDLVRLLQTLALPGGGVQAFIVRSGLAMVSTTGETYSFANVPVGSFGVQAERATLRADGSVSTLSTPVTPVTITSATLAAVNLAF